MVAKNACAVGPPTVSAFLGKSFLNCLRDFWNPMVKLRHLAHFRQCSERENSISKSSNPHLKGKSFPNEPISLAKDQCRTNRDQIDMRCFEFFAAAMPTAEREECIRFLEGSEVLSKRMERLLLPIAWRERETNGETTSFLKAVKCEAGEKVCAGWII